MAAQAPGALFFGSGQTVEQIDGELHGSLHLPFEVEPGDAEFKLRAGMKSVGEIALYAPGTATPYTGETSTRTAHMLVSRVTRPAPGTRSVHLAGFGAYLVNVTAQREREPLESDEIDFAGAESEDPSAAHGAEDLARLRAATPDRRWHEFRRLPDSRWQDLARALLDHPDPTVADVAAGSLARTGAIDEAVPVFARILVHGEDESALNGRMGYDWLHDDDPALAGRIIQALREHVRAHLDDYSPDERSRAQRLLGE